MVKNTGGTENESTSEKVCLKISLYFRILKQVYWIIILFNSKIDNKLNHHLFGK